MSPHPAQGPSSPGKPCSSASASVHCHAHKYSQASTQATRRGTGSEGRGWRGGETTIIFKSSLRPQRCVTCHPGAGDQGTNRHGSCTQPLPSRRQGLERDLPSLAVEPQLPPGPPGSLVLSANLQVLRGCLPTCSSRSLRGFSGQPSGLATRPPDNLVGIKHPVLRSFTRGTIPGKRTPGGLDENTRDTFRDIHRTESHLLLCPKCVDTACWNKLAVRFLREMRH